MKVLRSYLWLGVKIRKQTKSNRNANFAIFAEFEDNACSGLSTFWFHFIQFCARDRKCILLIRCVQQKFLFISTYIISKRTRTHTSHMQILISFAVTSIFENTHD